MSLIIQKEIFENFDKPIIGIIKVKGLNNHGISNEINDLLRDIEIQTRENFSKFESCGQHSNILAWRQAYKKFGSDPHKYRCSIESLVRRILKGDSIPNINKLVDIYNYISVKYVVPVGGEDSDLIIGELKLSIADGDEQFIRLNGTENDPPLSGEVIYKDEKGEYVEDGIGVKQIEQN